MNFSLHEAVWLDPRDCFTTILISSYGTPAPVLGPQNAKLRKSIHKMESSENAWACPNQLRILHINSFNFLSMANKFRHFLAAI